MLRVKRGTPHALLADRARGVMLGLAAGDALGAALEWDHPDQIVARYGGPLRDMVASKLWRLGEWTDDTAMATALAESLAERPAYDEDDVLARYLVCRGRRPRTSAPPSATRLPAPPVPRTHGARPPSGTSCPAGTAPGTAR
jgi:ADP-ribosylglycohydrolase